MHCEVAAGEDMVRKSLEAFTPSSVATTLVVDMMTYDAFPALACLQEPRGCREL